MCIKYSKGLFQFLGTVVIKMNCNNLALLWGEAQLQVVFALCLLKERKVMTFSDHIVTYSQPKMTFTILRMT